MKRKIVFLLITCTVFFTACQKNKSEYVQRAEESKNTAFPIIDESKLDTIMNNPDYTLNTKESEDVKRYELHIDGAKVRGMLALDKHMILVDYKNGQLIVVDENRNVIDRVGEFGSAPLEFQKPTGVTKDEQYIYVLDDGNSRVQLLDHRLNYVKEFNLDKSELDPGISFEDIEVDGEGMIYISGSFLTNPGVLVLNGKTGEQAFQGINFSGFLAVEEGQVLGLSCGQLYLPKEDPISFGIGTGECIAITCSPKESKKAYALEGINTFSDFLIKDGRMYCISQYHNELQKFTNDGAYEESLGELDANAVIQYICKDAEGKIYVSESSNRIFVFEEGNAD